MARNNLKYTKELLEPIVKECTSVRGVCEALGLKHAGGTHTHLRKKINEYEINTDHFRSIQGTLPVWLSTLVICHG